MSDQVKLTVHGPDAFQATVILGCGSYANGFGEEPLEALEGLVASLETALKLAKDVRDEVLAFTGGQS